MYLRGKVIILKGLSRCTYEVKLYSKRVLSRCTHGVKEGVNEAGGDGPSTEAASLPPGTYHSVNTVSCHLSHRGLFARKIYIRVTSHLRVLLVGIMRGTRRAAPAPGPRARATEACVRPLPADAV